MSDQKLKVEEIKAIAPLVDIYEFKKYMRYIIVIKPSRLIGGSSISKEQAEKITTILKQMKIHALLVKLDSEDFQIFELKPEG